VRREWGRSKVVRRDVKKVVDSPILVSYIKRRGI
jgi:hypothetical protein